MRIGQTSAIVFLSKLVGSVLAFFATVYFARILGAEVLGYYALIITIAKWLRLSGDIGVASAVTKRISEGESTSAYFTSGLIAVGILGLVTSAIVLLFRDQVNAYVGTASAAYIVVILLVGLLGTIIGAGLQGDRLVHILGVLTPVRMGATSLFQVALVVVGFGLSGMLIGYVLGGLLVAILGGAYLTVGIVRPRLKHFHSLFNFAKYSWLGSLRGRSFSDVDIIVLGALVSPTLVGIYSIAWNIANFIGLFGSSIHQTTFPELSRADSLEREKLLSGIISDSLAYTGLVAIPGLLGALVVGDRLLRIYGDEFTQGLTVLGLLILAMLIYDFQSQLLNVLDAIDRPDLSFRVSGFFIVSNLALNIVLVTAMGIEGAAIATALSASMGLLLASRYLFGLVEFDVPVVEISRQLLAALLMVLAVGSVRVGIESTGAINHNVIIVVSLVILGAGVYFSALFSLSPRFRTTVAKNSPIQLSFIR